MEKGKKKMGRPKSDNPKSNNIKVKVDDAMFKKLNDFASNKNKSMAQIIREAIESYIKTK